jgi:hypothetical protein
MMMWQAVRAGSRRDPHRPLPRRLDAWHRDATASAFAIARWEDDVGLVGGVRLHFDRPLSTDGRMAPHRNRNI